MLLADYIYTSSIQSFNLVAIGCLQGGKNSDVTGLELVGETAQDDVVFKAILQDLERLVCPEAVTNQYPWFLVSLSFSLGIKHMLEPLQADLGVGISRFRARIVPSRGGECGLVASMGSGWPNNHW